MLQAKPHRVGNAVLSTLVWTLAERRFSVLPAADQRDGHQRSSEITCSHGLVQDP